MGIKERRTKVLLALFLMTNADFGNVSINELVQKAFDLSLNQKTKSTFNQLIDADLIQKITINSSEQNTDTSTNKTAKKESQYTLTNKGFHELSLDFPFFRFLKDQWDGKLRILSYEIPESKRELRDKLRRKVTGWGLGPWHRSFWVTPHPIIENLRQLVSQKQEEQYIQAFEADHVFGDKVILIEKVWQKSQLEKKYRELFKTWHEILSQDENKVNKFQQVIAKYVDVLRFDPGLPKELIGESWIGFEAFNIYQEIRSILLS